MNKRLPKSLTNLTPNQWAYFAGFFDSSGKFPNIRAMYGTDRNGCKYLRHTISYAFDTENFNYAKEIADILGLRMVKVVRNLRPYYRVLFRINILKCFFKKILPYLKIFRQETIIAIRFRETFVKNGIDKTNERKSLKIELEKIKNENLLSR